ncbi:MAG: hypothetical protein ACK4GO_05615 [Gemmobacter sp.]
MPGKIGRAGRWFALCLCVALLSASCNDHGFARDLFVGVEGLGEIRYARASKGKPPEGVSDFTGLCLTAVADLLPTAPGNPPSLMPANRRHRVWVADWQPTSMPKGTRGLAQSCIELGGPSLQDTARRALAEPGSFWAVIPAGPESVDHRWSLYSPRHGIVGWAKAGAEG